MYFMRCGLIMKCDFLTVLVVAITLGFKSFSDETKSPMPFCEEIWTDGNSAGLGYLWMERFTTCNYEEAVRYCDERHSHLIEILTSEQMEFVVNKLIQLNTGYAIQPNCFQSCPSCTRECWVGWWGGASDEDQEGRWVWPESGKPVDAFVWGQNWEPNGGRGENHFCTFSWRDHRPYKFFGADRKSGDKIFPLCQQINCREPEPEHISTTSTTIQTMTPVQISHSDIDMNDKDTASAVGGSVAGIVVIALITTVVVWCWRTGKCRDNSNLASVDENEMYGREDYYDYHYHQDTMLWLLTRMTTMVAVTCTSPINIVPGGIQLFRTR